ncbi:MAG: sarcosine oxidase subunit delta [Phreatobacter sp.]|uniref:sarcosine oxidase subunit delta n=1 Tax=Phreatobacter sp. TaxID=1966341 RepID=UPI0027363C0A|nr:sarcosine oxidase subunit delta [Phreatobacter sp.]MDP2801486.1 sarcosine oxidase subunit delta [Phreatobacter sp.]
MRIPCPYCGPRDSSEFAYHGDAAPRRPADGDAAAMATYVYLRDNPAGPMEELWYHAYGCRSWLVVCRDTRDHTITGAKPVATHGATA